MAKLNIFCLFANCRISKCLNSPHALKGGASMQHLLFYVVIRELKNIIVSSVAFFLVF